jgi:hypothetical protein
LKEVLVEKPDDLWEYTSGYSDDAIAREFYTPAHLVASVRKKAFGKLDSAYGKQSPAGRGALEKRIAALERAFSALDPNWNKIKL